MPDYMTRFIRIDKQPNEEYFYSTEKQALEHMDLFKDDDSGLYKRIEVIQYSTNAVIAAIDC